MQNQIIILFVGFLLTTVVGGLLGYFFQNRAWKHQNDAKIFDAERAAATKIFEDISSLMDKRLYRMRQLNWKLRSASSEVEIIEGHMNEYRQVLYEWNDNLNRNLALTLRYFGKEIRKDLEGIVYEEFKRIGSLLEKDYSERKKNKTAHSESLDKEIILLGYHVYNLNVSMIALIQNGKVGIFNPDTSKRPHGSE